ncbi:MAG TPA: peptidoglycan DD-metalloendopeptidase family protein [Gaiellaceae bacterium]|nr:peptidoglycan DD-metalloendopeptidase family protein [Gaiellaceae bacterium]
MRRVAFALFVLLFAATPALADDVQKKHQVDKQIGALNARVEQQKQQEQRLRNSVSGYTQRIRDLEARVGDVSLRVSTLDADLQLHEKRLNALNKLYALQTGRYRFLQREYTQAVHVLEQRFVKLYESGQANTLEVVFGAQNLQSALDEVQYIKELSRNDRRIATAVHEARTQAKAARKRTTKLRDTVRGETRVIAERSAQARSVRSELVGAKNDIASQRQTQLIALDKLNSTQRAEAEEIDSLTAASASIAARIRAAQSRNSSGPTQTASDAGLVWPVSGPITSPFGWRWGRMHQGIDIGVGYGTPIHAAAGGTVIYCGWEEGYGNFVVIDHGGNLATAYGHQSSIAVTCGQQVDQGQVIGYVGCTGHCTGPHLHFEVRVDGNPVDPLGYLP